jgi:hypothetical protein
MGVSFYCVYTANIRTASDWCVYRGFVPVGTSGHSSGSHSPPYTVADNTLKVKLFPVCSGPHASIQCHTVSSGTDYYSCFVLRRNQVWISAWIRAIKGDSGGKINIPTGILRLPRLRFFRAFVSAVRHVPGYTSHRRGTVHTLSN